MTEHSGRLELTWTNKHERLLAREDGSYTWVPRADYRVAEVRLLRDAGATGETRTDAERAKDNLLIRGDALHALTSLNELPEFAAQYQGKVRLVYLDPPFNTQQAFAQYDDALEHSVWLTMMRDRLLQLKKLLAPDGSIWVHLDDTEMAYCRVMMDELFGRENFVATVIWEKTFSTKSSARHLSTDQDYILVYARSAELWRPNLLPRTEEADARYRNPDNDPRGPWTSGPLQARNFYAQGRYAIMSPSGESLFPPPGTYWRFSEDRFRQLSEDNRIWWGKDGANFPRLKRFLSEIREGIVPRTIWRRQEVGDTAEANREIRKLLPEAELFATPKPERLMERIVHIASNPGDVVLDCFAGSGTTAAVAHKLGRRWVTVEWSRETLETFTGPRLEKVVRGEDPGGITEAAGWEGGGGFRVLDVAPSMFDEDEGQVVLAEWAFGTALAEATAAQLGFAFDPDALPFCGRKGRSRLAVVDGLVNEGVVRLLAAELADDERLTVCGTMVDPAARDVLSELRPGSSLQKVPESILADYRLGQRWWDGHGRQESLPAADGDTAVDAGLPVD